MRLSAIAQATEDLRPVVITYTRFSTNIQKEGLSEYRQDELTQRYVLDFCEEHGVPVEDIISLKDRGISAYRGKNMTKGSLSEIIAKFNSGELPKVYNEKGEINTFLFIESLDRLSRADLHTANKLFLDLVEYCNIVVVAENEKKIYSLNSLKTDMGMLDLFSALLTLSRSHNESRMKEMRHRANWSKKRQVVIDYFELPEDEREGVEYPLNPTKTCPWWLRPKADNRGFEFIEEHKEAMLYFLNRMMEGHGLTSCIRRLNEKIENGELKVEFTERQKKAKGFQTHTFYQLLSGDDNESIIGNLIFHQDYYPTEKDVQQGLYEKKSLGKKVRIPVFTAKGFYPALLNEVEYMRLKQQMKQRKQSQTKPTKKVQNIAQGLLKCPLCGYSYVYVADNRKGRHHNLVCGLSRSKKCKSYTFRYKWFEKNLLNYCRNLDMNRILGIKIDNKLKERISELEVNALTYEQEIEVKNKELEQLVENLSKITIPTLLEKAQDQYVKIENSIKVITYEKEQNELELVDLKKRSIKSDIVSKEVYELIDSVQLQENVSLRERLNIELKKVISELYIYHKDNPNNYFGRNMIVVKFRDDYIRFIPLDRELEREELYNILPTISTKKAVDYSKYEILPFDYLEGLEEGRYPEHQFITKFYQENPDVLAEILSELDEADNVYV
ncbi:MULTISPECIES: recombinase family protein [Vibrio]|uniref:recombinase family protein n=1 Tax=Vibrio TaxID=662 RepID=UPI0029651763|nr:recombinase family protein [Vibrio sp. Vb1980]MDW1975651.1 recombinase family protein [Vibrio sp. Vb1980]